MDGKNRRQDIPRQPAQEPHRNPFPRCTPSGARRAGRNATRLPAFAVALACLLPALPAHAAASGEGARIPDSPIALVFRFDDLSAKSDTALERKVLGAFRARGLPLTLSVIPRIAARSAFDPSPQEGLPLPEEKVRILREALEGGAEVALHGFAHQTVRRRIGGRFVKRFSRYHSEFVGVDEEMQRRRIREGRALLEDSLGVRIESFVPPWNGYDRTTLRVLQESGFVVLSAARWGPVDLDSDLKFLPRTSDLGEVREAVRSARTAGGESPAIIVLFHHYDFAENNDAPAGSFTLQRLESLLDWVAGQKDLRVLTLGGAARSLSDLSARRFTWNRTALLWQLNPPWLNLLFRWPPRGVYLDLEAARRAKILLWGLVLLFTGGVALAGALPGRAGSRWALRRAPRPLRWARFVSPGLLAAVLLYALWDLEPYWGGMAAPSWLAGFSAGLL